MSGDDNKDFISLLDTGLRMKKKMQEDGVRSFSEPCVVCGGEMVATLRGRKDHLALGCTGTCKRVMME